MANVLENIERLIVRRLDGAISEDEALALDRELIRNPEARRLQEESQRIDAIAASALDGAVRRHAAFDVASLPPQARESFRPGFWTRWLVPGAIAAGLLALALARFPFERATEKPLPIAERTGGSADQAVPGVPRDYASGGMRYNASMGRPSIKRDTGREVIGVMGEDGNLYWIEVDRTRTVRLPGDVRF